MVYHHLDFFFFTYFFFYIAKTGHKNATVSTAEESGKLQPGKDWNVSLVSAYKIFIMQQMYLGKYLSPIKSKTFSDCD